MILTRNEAICLILNFSKDKEINSLMKLNKLVARLNLYFIPIAVNFSLNKWGSFNADLRDLKPNEYFNKSFYDYKDKKIPLFQLKKEGNGLAEQAISNKIKKILRTEELDELKKDIFEKSQLPAEELSQEEHKDLLVDKEDRQQLIQRINTAAVDLFDLYHEIDKIPKDTIEGIRLAGLVEYCYLLSKYFKNRRFRNIENEGYEQDSLMADYYLLYLLDKQVISHLKKMIDEKDYNRIIINQYYQYFVNAFRDKSPFSLDNPNLFKLAQ